MIDIYFSDIQSTFLILTNTTNVSISLIADNVCVAKFASLSKSWQTRWMFEKQYPKT